MFKVEYDNVAEDIPIPKQRRKQVRKTPFVIKLQCWLLMWLQKMEQQSIERGLSGERQLYILENKKDANKFDKRKQVTGNIFFNQRQEVCELLSKKPNNSYCLPYHIKKKSGNHPFLRHLRQIDSVKLDDMKRSCYSCYGTEIKIPLKLN